MNMQNIWRRIPWLPTLIVVWNIIDIVVHVALNMAEPWRIAGNVVGIVAALVVVFGVAKLYAWQTLSGAAVVVVVLNMIHSILHGWLTASFIFIGVSLILLLLWAQKLYREANAGGEYPVYVQWWAAIGATAVGILLITLVGEQGPLPIAPLNQLHDGQLLEAESALVPQAVAFQDGSEVWGGYRAGLYGSAFSSERGNLNGTKAVRQGGFPRGTSVDDIAVELIEMPYPALLYTRESNEIFIFGGTPLIIEDYVSLMDGKPAGDNDAVPYLAKYNTATGKITRLELDRGRGLAYLGGALVHANGYVYAVSQVHLYKINPETMTIERSTNLERVGLGFTTIYNGLAVSSTGELILKSLSSFGGTQKISLVDPTTLEITFTMRGEFASPHLTVAPLANGEEYLYHLNQKEAFRYLIEPGSLTLDED